MEKKRQYWSKYVEKCVSDKKHFTLLNLLARKGKVWVDYAPISSCRDKRPTITDNLDRTKEVWRD